MNANEIIKKDMLLFKEIMAKHKEELAIKNTTITTHEEDYEVYNNYCNDCKHNNSGRFDHMIMCFDCGEVLIEQVYSYGPAVKNKMYKKKESARMMNYNKTIRKMFPDVFPPNGNIIMNDIEKRFNQLEENVGSFPCMKDVIYFILQKCERLDLANTITLSKSKRSQNILEKLFEDKENTNE